MCRRDSGFQSLDLTLNTLYSSSFGANGHEGETSPFIAAVATGQAILGMDGTRTILTYSTYKSVCTLCAGLMHLADVKASLLSLL